MAFEVWDTESRNLVDWFNTRAELRAALREMTDLTGLQVAVRSRRGKTTWLDPESVLSSSQAPRVPR